MHRTRAIPFGFVLRGHPTRCDENILMKVRRFEPFPFTANPPARTSANLGKIRNLNGSVPSERDVHPGGERKELRHLFGGNEGR